MRRGRADTASTCGAADGSGTASTWPGFAETFFSSRSSLFAGASATAFGLGELGGATDAEGTDRWVRIAAFVRSTQDCASATPSTRRPSRARASTTAAAASAARSLQIATDA